MLTYEYSLWKRIVIIMNWFLFRIIIENPKTLYTNILLFILIL